MAEIKTAKTGAVKRGDDSKEKASVRLRLQGYSPERIAELIAWRVELVKFVLRKRTLY